MRDRADSLPMAFVHVALIMTTVLLIWTSIGTRLSQERFSDQRAAEIESRNLTAAFADNIARTLDAVDGTLLLVREGYAADHSIDLARWTRNDPFLKSATFQISLIDRDGRLVASNVGPAEQVIDVSDREYFRAQRDSTNDRLYISQPLAGRLSHRILIQVARKILGPGGVFEGVAVVSIDPAPLLNFARALDLDRVALLLVGTDGVVRARSPPEPDLVGQRLSPRSTQMLLEGAPFGTFDGIGDINGTRRIISYQRVTGYPLVASVGLGMAQVFANYRLHRTQYPVVGLLLSFVVVVVGVSLIAQHKRLIRSRGRLSAALANVEGVTSELRRRTNELAGVQHMARLGSWSWRSDGDRIAMSEELAMMLDGSGEQAMPTQMLLSRIHSDDRAHISAVFAANMRGAVPFNVDVRIESPGLGMRHYRVEARPMPRAPDAPVELRGFCQDISDLKHAQAAVLRAEKLQIMGQLTGGIAHDFNNLLTVAIINLEESMTILTEARPDGATDSVIDVAAEVVPMLGMAHHAAVRGGELTSQLLSYARRQPLRPQPLDLAAFLDALTPMLERVLGSRHKFALRVDPTAPVCLVDPAQLEHALLNLVLNARDALPQGGLISIATSRADVAASSASNTIPTDDIATGDYAVVTVSDNGSGIPPDIQARVFEPFFTTKDIGQGSGLGLSMVDGFARQSGGHVEIDSVPGRGTAVRIYLPACRDAGTLPASPRSHQMPA